MCGCEARNETWWGDKLTVIGKLEINDLILLLPSTDGPLVRYLHVFRIMQNVQERFEGGIFYVLTCAFNWNAKLRRGFGFARKFHYLLIFVCFMIWYFVFLVDICLRMSEFSHHQRFHGSRQWLNFNQSTNSWDPARSCSVTSYVTSYGLNITSHNKQVLNIIIYHPKNTFALHFLFLASIST